MTAEAFAGGYALHGTFPMPDWAVTAGHAAVETLPAGLLEAAGDAEGRRAAIHKRREQLWAVGTAATLAHARRLGAHIDPEHLVDGLLLPASGSARAVLRQITLDHLLRALQADPDLDEAWQESTADAYTDALAEGTAEAAASDRHRGGPPDPALLPDLWQAARGGASSALAGAIATTWRREQITGLAGDVARLIPNADTAAGISPDTVTSLIGATQQALDDAAGVAFYAEEQQASATSLGFLTYLPLSTQVDFITVGDSHVDGVCAETEGANPWPAAGVPQPPIHPRCRCHLEVAANPLAVTA